MIVGFLGKGGSGKSTISAAFCEFLLSRRHRVLAIDADHNMDLLFNLKVAEMPNWLGASMEDLLALGGLAKSRGDYRSLFDVQPALEFRLAPMDAFTAKYSRPARANLWVMAGGPHTDQILFDRACSHVLTTPLKVVLPHFRLDPGSEFIVVDEKAGSDGAGTGVAAGLDAGVVVLEPNHHGVKAACQISKLLEFFGTPHCFLVNKVTRGDRLAWVEQMLPAKPLLSLGFEESVGWGPGEDDEVSLPPRWDFSPLLSFARRLELKGEAGERPRYRRALERMTRNQEYARR